MQGVRICNQQPDQRRGAHDVPWVLRPSGGVGAAITAEAGNDACCDRALSGRSWPGRDFGVREPYPGETALSWSEVHFAHERGLL